MNSLRHVESALKKESDLQKARIFMSFFKTGPGQYGEGDAFLGVNVPTTRLIAKTFRHLSLAELEQVLQSRYHEARLLGLVVLVHQYEKGNTLQKSAIFKAYLRNIPQINNWDLVDLSAPNIVGAHLEKRNRKILLKLAGSRDLWTRRIAILATFFFIRRNDFSDALKISERLLHDEHDLIHKAVGWMLREIGKRDPEREEAFLNAHHRIMPRTMLRYAIERFPEKKRLYFLRKPIN